MKSLTYPIFLLLLIICTDTAFGQQPKAYNAPKGIYIYLDNTLAANYHVDIERATAGQNNYFKAGTVAAPSSRQQLTTRIKQLASYYSDQGTYTQADIDTLWAYLQHHTSLDSAFPVNYPLMFLAAGNAFYDTLAEKNTSYTYRLSYYHNSKLIGTKTTNQISYPKPARLPKPVLHDKNTGKYRVYLEWSIAPDQMLNSFAVYRRQNLAGEFKKIHPVKGFYTKHDSLFLVANDTLVKPAFVYEYYITPLDLVGNPSLNKSDITQTATFTRDLIPVLENFYATPTGSHQVTLNWKYRNTDMVRSIELYRSPYYDSGFMKIASLQPRDTIYTDNMPVANENYYYYIVLQGIEGKSYPGAKISALSENRNNPAPPEEVAAKPVKNGIKVFWLYEDPEVKGYYVYRDNGRGDSLLQISDLITPADRLMSFIDSSKSLDGSENYRYAVKSINDNYLFSDFSEIVNASPMIPGSISPPVNLRATINENKITLIWNNEEKTAKNLLGYNIYRKTEKNDSYKKLNEYPLLSENNYFEDTSLILGQTVIYAVTALNMAGTESSYSRPAQVSIPVKKGILPPPAGLHLTKITEGILITWTPVTQEGLTGYAIYRYEPGNPPQKIAMPGANHTSKQDTNVEKGKLYFYYITSINKTKQESTHSGTERIRF